MAPLETSKGVNGTSGFDIRGGSDWLRDAPGTARAVEAGTVFRAELRQRPPAAVPQGLRSVGPTGGPAASLGAAVNDLLGRDEFKPLRISVNRGRPLGEESWMWSTARRLGLQFTLRSPGRPRRKRQNQMSRYSRT